MALDAALLGLVAAELKTTLEGSRIDKIFEPNKEEIILLLRTRTETFRLLLSARSGSARICLTQEAFENPQVPPGFCMLLRKHLTGGKLLDVRRLPGDRIVFFDFQCTNEMGDLVVDTLAAELMGRYANLVLVQDGKILDALKRVDFEASDVRQLLPGLAYTLPDQPEKLSLLTSDPHELVARTMQRDLPVADALMKTVGEVGPVICREVVWRAFGSSDLTADRMNDTQQALLCRAIENLQAEYAQGGTPCSVVSDAGKSTEYSFTRLTQYGGGYVLTEYPGYSTLLESYYLEKDRAERLRQRTKELQKSVKNLHERAVRKQAARLQELAQSKNGDTSRLYGELVNANLWAIQKGMKSVELLNYYTNTPVQVPLDPMLTPQANAQRYFKDYKKKQTAARMLDTLLKKGEEEIAYLEAVLYEVSCAGGEQAVSEIREELKSEGYLKNSKARPRKQKPSDFIRYLSSDGFEILVGRNNTQNDKLSLHTARGCDIWFHVQKAPGSHTVVITGGQPVPDTTLDEAAQLAVIHSSVNGGAKVPVDTTRVRNLKKPAGAKPGMVVYEVYTTVYAQPREGLQQQLQPKK